MKEFIQRQWLKLWASIHGHVIFFAFLKSGVAPDDSRLYGSWISPIPYYDYMFQDNQNRYNYGMTTLKLRCKFQTAHYHCGKFLIIGKVGNDLITYKIPADEIKDYKKFIFHKKLTGQY
jgi:hypothetical protein